MSADNIYNGSSYARRLAVTLRNAYEVHDRVAFDAAIARMVATMEYVGPVKMVRSSLSEEDRQLLLDEPGHVVLMGLPLRFDTVNYGTVSFDTTGMVPEHQLHEHERVTPQAYTGPERRRSGSGANEAMLAHLSDLARAGPPPMCETNWPGLEARQAISALEIRNRHANCTRRTGPCECENPHQQAQCMHRAQPKVAGAD